VGCIIKFHIVHFSFCINKLLRMFLLIIAYHYKIWFEVSPWYNILLYPEL
jgi:hypothetical protein